MIYNNEEEMRKNEPEIPLGKAHDLSGQRYGSMTCLYRCVSNDSYKSTRWGCKCDCGNYFTVLAGNITKGRQISCGCYLQKKRYDIAQYRSYSENHENLEGNTYGYLSPIKYMGVDKNNHALWRCQCLCGKEIIVPASHLKTGHTTSCGCKRTSQYEERIAKWLDDHGYKYEREIRVKELGLLRFDYKIYLGSFYIFLEMQGQQHYFPVEKFGGQQGYERRIKNDQNKIDYCAQVGIQLYHIKYSENIEKRLSEILCLEGSTTILREQISK